MKDSRGVIKIETIELPPSERFKYLCSTFNRNKYIRQDFKQKFYLRLAQMNNCGGLSCNQGVPMRSGKTLYHTAISPGKLT